MPISSIEQAIRLAIEGGWKIYNVEEPDEQETAIRFYTKNPYKMFLDPAFWQSLGKALGWEGSILADNRSPQYSLIEWLHHWHHFIDHLSDEKPPESFFAEILFKKDI